MTDKLLKPAEVHAEYGIAYQTLSNYRWQGIGPDYIKTTPGKAGRIRYRRSAIEQWLKEATHQASPAATWTPQGRLDQIKTAYQRWDNDELTDAQLCEAVGAVLYPG